MKRLPFATPSSPVPLSTCLLPPKCHPLTVVEGRNRCQCLTWRRSFRLRTRSGLKQRTIYLSRIKRLLTWWLPILTKVFWRRKKSIRRTRIQRTWMCKRRTSRRLVGASIAASKAILLRPIKHQRCKKSRRSIMSIKSTSCYALSGDISLQQL